MPTEIGTVVAHVNGEDCTYHLVLLDDGPRQPIAIGPYSDCRGLDLSYLDMTGWDLRSASFSGGKLFSTIMSGADARGAQLEEVEACGIWLEGTELQGAKARSGDFSDAHASRVMLNGADVTYSLWHGAEVDGDAFRGVSGSKGMVRSWADLGRPDVDEAFARAQGRPATPLGEPPAWVVADQEAHERLDAIEGEQVSRLADQDEFEKFLNLQARYLSFSPRNVMLIAGQKPEATWLASYDKWTELGRHVRLEPGERPVEVRVPYGPPEGSTSSSAQRNLRVLQLLDVSQTAGSPVSDLGAFNQRAIDVDEAAPRLAAYSGRLGVAVDPEDNDVILASVAACAGALAFTERSADLIYYLAARNLTGESMLAESAPAAPEGMDERALLDELAVAQAAALLISRVAREDEVVSEEQNVYAGLSPWAQRETHDASHEEDRTLELESAR